VKRVRCGRLVFVSLGPLRGRIAATLEVVARRSNVNFGIVAVISGFQDLLPTSGAGHALQDLRQHNPIVVGVVDIPDDVESPQRRRSVRVPDCPYEL